MEDGHSLLDPTVERFSRDVDSYNNVASDAYYDPDNLMSSRLSCRFMFAELVGTFIFTVIAVGTDLSSGTLASTVSYREDRSPGRILVMALGNAMALSALMYTVYSFMRLRHRAPRMKFKSLESDPSVHQKVYMKGHNLHGWIEGTVEMPTEKTPEGCVKVRPTRNDIVKEKCRRENLRIVLKKGDIARNKDDEDVEIRSKLKQQHNNDYDIRRFDGTITRDDIWNLRLPSRDRYVVGHFNPAITYAATLLGEIEPEQGVMYILAQLFGGCLGAAFVKVMIPDFGTNEYGTSLPVPGISNSEACLAEGALTMLFVLIALATFMVPWERMHEPDTELSQLPHPFFKELSPLLLGLSVFSLSVMGASTTGAPMNIARTLGASFVTDDWSKVYVYAIGAWGGSIVAALVWALSFSGKLFCDCRFLTQICHRELVLYCFFSVFRAFWGLMKRIFSC